MAETNIFAIDFGGSNLRANYVTLASSDAAPEPQSAPLQGALFGALPGILRVNSERRVLSYGALAQQEMAGGTGTQDFVYDFKTSMGRAADDLVNLETGSRDAAAARTSASRDFRYTREEAFFWAESLLRCVEQDVRERVFGDALSGSRGWKIAVGIPAHWKWATSAQFQETVARVFQNEDVELLGEPEAALAYHRWRDLLSPAAAARSLLIIDSGAETTTIALAPAGAGQSANAGALTYHSLYGGTDFDGAFSDYVARRVGCEGGELAPMALRQRGRELKEEFNRRMAAGAARCQVTLSVWVKGAHHTGSADLDRAEFQSGGFCGPLVEEFDRMVEAAMQKFRASHDSISGVIFVGGNASWYFMRERLQMRFSRAVIIAAPDGEQAVSKGLALIPALRAAGRGDSAYAVAGTATPISKTEFPGGIGMEILEVIPLPGHSLPPPGQPRTVPPLPPPGQPITVPPLPPSATKAGTGTGNGKGFEILKREAFLSPPGKDKKG